MLGGKWKDVNDVISYVNLDPWRSKAGIVQHHMTNQIGRPRCSLEQALILKMSDRVSKMRVQLSDMMSGNRVFSSGRSSSYYNPQKGEVCMTYPTVWNTLVSSRAYVKKQLWFAICTLMSRIDINPMLLKEEKEELTEALKRVHEILERTKYNQTTKTIFENLNL